MLPKWTVRPQMVFLHGFVHGVYLAANNGVIGYSAFNILRQHSMQLAMYSYQWAYRGSLRSVSEII